MTSDDRRVLGAEQRSGRARLALLAVGIGLAMLCLQLGIDWAFLGERAELMYSDVFVAMSSAVLSFLAMRYYDRQKRIAVARLAAVAEINHHVRNALAAISLSVYVKGDPELTKTVQESIGRIDWVLREIVAEPMSLPESMNASDAAKAS